LRFLVVFVIGGRAKHQKAERTAETAMHILFPTWSLSLVMLVGCAVPGHNTKEPPEEITHRSDYWREEASESHEMAAHREGEADVLSKKKQETLGEEFVTRMRAMAKQLHAAAEYAEEQAQEAQRQSARE
jgi:hypothetical protein